MALYAFDGTWDHKSNNTNVQKFYETYNRNFRTYAKFKNA